MLSYGSPAVNHLHAFLDTLVKFIRMKDIAYLSETCLYILVCVHVHLFGLFSQIWGGLAP